MLSEGIHSIVDTGNRGLLLLGLGFVFEGVAWLLVFREFNRARGRLGMWRAVRQSKDPSTFVVLFEDSAAVAGILVAFLGIRIGQLTGWWWLDGSASIVIGLILAVTAWLLAVETRDLLIGECAEPRVVQGIRRLASEAAAVEHVDEVLTLHMGPEYILVNLSLDCRDDIGSAEVEKSIAQLEKRIRHEFPASARCPSRPRAGPVAGRRPPGTTRADTDLEQRPVPAEAGAGRCRWRLERNAAPYLIRPIFRVFTSPSSVATRTR